MPRLECRRSPEGCMWDLTSVIISADKQVYISLAAILSLTAKAIDA